VQPEMPVAVEDRDSDSESEGADSESRPLMKNSDMKSESKSLLGVAMPNLKKSSNSESSSTPGTAVAEVDAESDSLAELEELEVAANLQLEAAARGTHVAATVVARILRAAKSRQDKTRLLC
jgi:hypothetical protein